MRGQAIELRVLSSVLAAVCILFGLTTVLARWYENERHERARESYRRGERLAAAGRHEAAVEEFRNALSVARGSTEYRIALARSLVALKQNSEASLHLHEVLRSDPAAGLPNLLLARIAWSENRLDAAIAYYNRAVYGYWPPGEIGLRRAARWELVQVLAKSGQARQVVAELIRAADEAGGDPAIQKRAARGLLEYGSPHQARDLARSVLREQPSDATARNLLGEAEFAAGNYISAQAALRRAVAADPQNEEYRRNLRTVSEALALDPTLRGLDSRERLRRSHELGSRALEALESCLSGKIVPPETAVLVEDAKSALARRVSDRARATDINISLAEQLWQHARDVCASQPTDETVGRVLARISK